MLSLTAFTEFLAKIQRVEGFEPPDGRSAGGCLTAWLYPQNFLEKSFTKLLFVRKKPKFLCVSKKVVNDKMILTTYKLSNHTQT